MSDGARSGVIKKVLLNITVWKKTDMDDEATEIQKQGGNGMNHKSDQAYVGSEKK